MIILSRSPLLAKILSAAVLGCMVLAHTPDLFVTGFFSNDVRRFFGPQAPAPGTPHPAPGKTGAEYATNVARRVWGLTFGPSGDLFIANQQGGDGAIKRVQGPFGANPGAPLPAPGQAEDIFVASGNYIALAIGLDQNLYAGCGGGCGGPIRRFDIVTGSSAGDFTSGNVPGEVFGLAFGPDLNLYVSSFNSCVTGPTGCKGTRGEILQFDGKRGHFLKVFVANGVGGLTQPGGITFGTGGDLFVCNQFDNGVTGSVLRFHGPLSGAAGSPFPAPSKPGAVFANLSSGLSPFNVAFGPDRMLYVAHGRGVSSFNGHNGAVVVANFASVLDARGLAFYSTATTASRSQSGSSTIGTSSSVISTRSSATGTSSSSTGTRSSATGTRSSGVSTSSSATASGSSPPTGGAMPLNGIGLGWIMMAAGGVILAAF